MKKVTKYQWTPDAWNETYPIGIRVRVTSVAAHDGRPAQTFDSVTRSKCWALGDGNPVVLVEGKTGGYSVEPGWMMVLVDDPAKTQRVKAAIKNAVELLGPEYCDDGKPLESLRRALDEMETAKEQASRG